MSYEFRVTSFGLVSGFGLRIKTVHCLNQKISIIKNKITCFEELMIWPAVEKGEINSANGASAHNP